MQSRGPSGSSGSDGNDPPRETWEEQQRRMQKRGEYKGLAWIVLAHAPTTDAYICLLYTSPSPRDRQKSRMPSSA